MQGPTTVVLVTLRIVKPLEYPAEVLVPLAVGVCPVPDAANASNGVASRNSLSCSIVRSLLSSLSITIQ